MKLEDIDLTDEDTWADRIPHDQFSFLRAEAPIYRHPGNTVGDRVIEDFWGAHPARRRPGREPGHHHVLLRTAGRHGQRAGRGDLGPLPDDAGHRPTGPHPPAPARQPGLHAPHGHPLRGALRPADVRPRLAKAMAQGTCDFVTDVAAELPLQAIAEILGVPHEDRHKLFEWSNRMIGADDPEYASAATTPHERAGRAVHVRERSWPRSGGPNPRDDIVTDADQRRGRRRQLSSHRVRHLLPAARRRRQRDHPQRHLARHARAAARTPTSAARCATTPTLLDPAIEEILRWATPVMHFRRTATRDTELRGQAIKPRATRSSSGTSRPTATKTVFDDPFTLRHHPRPERAHRLRRRRAALLPRRQPGPHRDAA